MVEPEDTETVGPIEPPTHVAASVPSGSCIGWRYEVISRLGQGGNAVVYRVFDRELRREVALKLLRPERDTPAGRSRLRHEVSASRDAASPHLVRIFDFGSGSEGAYLTMEILPGGSLADRLRGGALPVEEAIRIGSELLAALADLHPIVHRDVKPGNILFDAEGRLRLGDFGLALWPEGEETRSTLPGGLVGTYEYLSPEQASGIEAGPQSDLYSAGLVLFEMIAGKLPQRAEPSLGFRLAPLSPAPNIRSLQPRVPRWLARAIARLLEVRPADRYPSARAALADLERRHAPARPRLRRRLVRVALVNLLLLPQVGVLVTRTPAARFSRLVPLGEKGGVAAIDKAGERLWKIEGVGQETANRVALARLTPGGPRLIATVLTRPQDWSSEAVFTLCFLDPATGQVVRRAKLPTGQGFFPDDPPRFYFSSIKTVDLFHDGIDEVLVGYSHIPEAPSFTVLYEPRFDRARVIYYSRGGQSFQGAVDLDGDGSLELLFAGINNGWNWVNVVAAVKLDPWPWGQEPWGPVSVAAPDVSVESAEERNLLWYAIVPRGHFNGVSFMDVDEPRRELTLHYATGKTWTLGFDGFPKDGSSPALGAERQAARRETYEHFREAERLRRAGAFDLAMADARAGFQSAQRARDVWLTQYAERIEGKILVAEGKLEEAEAHFRSLLERAEDAPEMAYDAAVAFHLYGDLPRAIQWYERGVGRESAMGAGKSKHEFLKGEVLALVEEKRYAEALAAVDRFGVTYPPVLDHTWVYREYIRWRAGERPEPDPAGTAWSWTDLERYWELEFALADGKEPQEILGRVDRFLAERPETRAEALSLRAEILSRLGHDTEAAEVAQSALELVRVEAARSIIARGHASLLAERARRLGGALR
jgi:tetratricopeptide (TPR) repeat protein